MFLFSSSKVDEEYFREKIKNEMLFSRQTFGNNIPIVQENKTQKVHSQHYYNNIIISHVHLLQSHYSRVRHRGSSQHDRATVLICMCPHSLAKKKKKNTAEFLYRAEQEEEEATAPPCCDQTTTTTRQRPLKMCDWDTGDCTAEQQQQHHTHTQSERTMQNIFTIRAWRKPIGAIYSHLDSLFILLMDAINYPSAATHDTSTHYMLLYCVCLCLQLGQTSAHKKTTSTTSYRVFKYGSTWM